MGSQDCLQAFIMALHHKWNVTNGFAYVLQFFSLISDSLDGVIAFPCFGKVVVFLTFVDAAD
mgnify:FL=1